MYEDDAVLSAHKYLRLCTMLCGNSSESVDSTGFSENAYPASFSRTTEQVLLHFTHKSNLQQLT